MKRVLLVDDDPFVLRFYQERLSPQEMQVETAADGLAAINLLRVSKPDVVVLDLMMPKLSGVDVLKFIRSQADLKTLPVVVLSNSYMNQLAVEAAKLGAQTALLKIRCTPALLASTIQDILAGKPGSGDAPHLLAVPAQSPPAPLSSAPAGRAAPATCAALRSLCQAFTNAPNKTARGLRLQEFCRKVHFTTAAAGLAGCHGLAQATSALEALLFELVGKPEAISASVLRTIAATVDFLALLFDCARDADMDLPLAAQVLVVDDDQLNNRLVVSALHRAQLQARSTSDPLAGLQWLKETRFDLVLLDIEMPGLDGLELCRRLRQLPGYEKTPVIYVTSHSDFESRAASVLSGGNDLIAKPIFPMELAVKAVVHLLKHQVAGA